MVEPHEVYEPETGNRRIQCSCGGQLTPEKGRLLDIPHRQSGDSHEWLWWRCEENPRHVTRALPLPVTMARG